MCAFPGPVGANHPYFDIIGFGLVHATGAQLGREVCGTSWNIEHNDTGREQGANLSSLHLANFQVIGSDREYRSLESSAEFLSILRLAIEQRPSHACSRGSLCNHSEGRTRRLA